MHLMTSDINVLPEPIIKKKRFSKQTIENFRLIGLELYKKLIETGETYAASEPIFLKTRYVVEVFYDNNDQYQILVWQLKNNKDRIEFLDAVFKWDMSELLMWAKASDHYAFEDL